MTTTPISVENALAYLKRVERINRRLSARADYGLDSTGDTRHYTVHVYLDGAHLQSCSTCEDMNALVRALEVGRE